MHSLWPSASEYIPLFSTMTALTEALEVPVPDSNGFPPGYFVIRSIACNRNWDVSGDSVEDGTDVILHPEKEPSLVECMSCFLYS